MIAFIIDPKIMKWMTEYVKSVQDYLSNRFDLHSDIVYNNSPQSIKTTHTVLIFIQKVTPGMIPGMSRYPRGRLPDTQSEPSRRVFLLNTEQVTLPKTLCNIKRAVKTFNVGIIDYSLVNIKLMREHFPNTTFVHFPFVPCFKEPVPKTIDLISLRTPSSVHRNDVLSGVGLFVKDFYGLWGAQRDSQIAASKILINLHYNTRDYRVLETIRCYNALEKGTLVVSEPGMYDSENLLHDYIFFAELKDLPKVVSNILENYEVWYNDIFNAEKLQELDNRLVAAYRNALEIIFERDCNF